MFGLEAGLGLIFLFCILAACAFEFVNGFHDTANAVATVIYTNSLRPWAAVVWSAFCNFCGVFLGGIGVAMGIVNLLPPQALMDLNVYHSISMILAILFAAIIWNLGTWYYGLPASSSHTLIGSILGVGLAFNFLPGDHQAAVNWGKAGEIGMSLLLSPLFGFSATIFLMFFLRRLLGKKTVIFKEPDKKNPPPAWIRVILIITCTMVSFFHGSNDGQKGVGLIMLILITVLPAYFALNQNYQLNELQPVSSKILTVTARIDTTLLSVKEKEVLEKVETNAAMFAIDYKGSGDTTMEALQTEKSKLRNEIIATTKGIDFLLKSENVNLNIIDKTELRVLIKDLRTSTDYSPIWVTFLVSLSLGLGTMIGWKRIVVTIGEKIGKQHLTYAQGASAELVAASTIGLSTFLSLPVSTTHVLSSGIAGSMVANKGIKNLRPDTVRNILLAWLLTLPVSITLSGGLFLLFRWLF
jgi:PiT family inorganic phosphate transporter